jgi:hypothetical protein
MTNQPERRVLCCAALPLLTNDKLTRLAIMMIICCILFISANYDANISTITWLLSMIFAIIYYYYGYFLHYKVSFCTGVDVSLWRV